MAVSHLRLHNKNYKSYIKYLEPDNMKNKKTVFLIIILSFLFLLPLTAIADMVSIKRDNVNMRSGPGTNYSVLWQLGSGFPLRVLERRGSWLRVQDFEGDIGWASRVIVNRTPHMVVRVHKNRNKRINIRSGPGTNHRIVAKAYYGVVFRTLRQERGWVQVQHEKGVTGWIKRTLLWGF